MLPPEGSESPPGKRPCTLGRERLTGFPTPSSTAPGPPPRRRREAPQRHVASWGSGRQGPDPPRCVAGPRKGRGEPPTPAPVPAEPGLPLPRRERERSRPGGGLSTARQRATGTSGVAFPAPREAAGPPELPLRRPAAEAAAAPLGVTAAIFPPRHSNPSTAPHGGVGAARPRAAAGRLSAPARLPAGAGAGAVGLSASGQLAGRRPRYPRPKR